MESDIQDREKRKKKRNIDDAENNKEVCISIRQEK